MHEIVAILQRNRLATGDNQLLLIPIESSNRVSLQTRSTKTRLPTITVYFQPNRFAVAQVEQVAWQPRSGDEVADSVDYYAKTKTKISPKAAMKRLKSSECLLSCHTTYHDYIFMQSIKILHFSRTYCKFSDFDIFGPHSRGIVIAVCIRMFTGYQNIRRPRKLPLKKWKIINKYAMEFTSSTLFSGETGISFQYLQRLQF